MSLLSTLLAFSSYKDQYEKQQRSLSAQNKLTIDSSNDEQFKQKHKCKNQSKSLSKINLISNSSVVKINPKQRCLHRIVHNLSMKVRKYYYTFFVILQTMKKNNVTINKITSIPNQKIKIAINKIDQTFSIRYQKQYQNNYKIQCFKKIHLFSIKSVLPHTIDHLFTQIKYRYCTIKLFNYFNHLQKIVMKIDLLKSSLQSIINNDNITNKKYFINKIKISKPQTKPKQISIFEMFEGFQKKSIHFSVTDLEFPKPILKTKINSIQLLQDTQQDTIKLKNNTTLNIQDTSIQQNIKNIKPIIYQNINPTTYQSANKKSEQPHERTGCWSQTTLYRSQIKPPLQDTLTNSLYASPLQKLTSRTKSAYPACKKVLSLKDSLFRQTIQSKTYQQMYKSYKPTLNLDQKPFQFYPKHQKLSKILSKLTPQQLPFSQVQDLADKSNIFRDFKDSKIIELDNSEVMHLAVQAMSPLGISNDIDRHIQKYQGLKQKSQLSYMPYLQHDNSISTINHREQSSFGSDAVNFKNSLVSQRQSMKKVGKKKIDLSLKNKNLGNSNEIQSPPYSINLKNNIKLNNQITQKKILSAKICGYSPNYAYDSDYHDYNIKSQISPFNIMRNSNTTMLNGGTNPYHAYQLSKPYHQFNSQNRPKSHSINSITNDTTRKISQQPISFKINPKISDITIKNYPSSLNSSLNVRQSKNSKNQFINNCTQLPVRDVADPLAKLRMKNNNLILLKINKQQPYIHKPFGNITKI